MKKLYFLAVALFSTVLIQAQTIQGTVKAGSQANSVIVALKPSAQISGSKLSTFYFSLAIPATINPRPTATILTNFNTAISYTLEVVNTTELIGGVQHWVYNFLGDGSQAVGVERDLLAADNNMVEIVFNGGPVGLYDVKIVSLPDGGASANSYLNVYDRGIDITNTAAMFYGGTPVNSPSGYSGLSYTLVANIALPVKFLSFFALKNGDDARLNWTVENDQDNMYFELERSLDGRAYTSFAKVSALANGRTVNTYESTDANLSSFGKPTAYYRVKQVDRNGEITYSNVRMLYTNKRGTPANLFPNPAKTITKLVFDSDEQVQGSVLIRDMTGKMAKQFNMTFNKGINQQNLPVAELASGEYNVTIVAGKQTHLLKLTKIN